jgi:glutathione-regulated potassium-efflux system protein KefB
MPNVTLAEVALLLAAMAIAAPLARWLGVGTILGYLVAGVVLGPSGLPHVFNRSEAREILELAEFGIVLLLFLIGLELRPRRLWSMRGAIFSLGGAQVAVTGALIAAAGLAFGFAWQTALFVGLALALSSTAFALQVLEEAGDLQARHGRLAFAVLLFQDLAAIPLIALAPIFTVTAAAAATPSMDLMAAVRVLAAIVGVTLAGYFVLDHLLRLVARTRVREAMTAAALLTVVGVALAMQQAGVSASLGAFIAGALLAESSYRHQLEADIQPFQGLLLGLFFTAIGMSLNVKLVIAQPLAIVGTALALVAAKTLVLAYLGRRHGLEAGPSRRLGLALSQGGEFAFVLLSVGLVAGAVARPVSDFLVAVVIVSMATTPLLLALERALVRARGTAEPKYETPPESDGHVVIAGFGRYGQIVARVLRGKRIPFTALDISSEQVELVKKFGSEAFYGDASRIEILEAAKVGRARAFVLAIDDVEASLRTAEIVTSQYSHVPVFARARNRNHAHRLLDLGVSAIQRETFLSALETTRQVLNGLGYSERETDRVLKTFRAHDERRLSEDYLHYSDMEKMQAKARSDPATLERLFAEDAAEEARLAASEAPQTAR